MKMWLIVFFLDEIKLNFQSVIMFLSLKSTPTDFCFLFHPAFNSEELLNLKKKKKKVKQLL